MPRIQPRFISFQGGIDECVLLNTLPPPMTEQRFIAAPPADGHTTLKNLSRQEENSKFPAPNGTGIAPPPPPTYIPAPLNVSSSPKGVSEMHDAHANEYAAAIAGMADTYGNGYAVGDHVSFRLKGWSDQSYDDGRVIGHHNGRLLVETASDIVEVDPRPWPVGNLLPF